jgi:hypothetical protein
VSTGRVVTSESYIVELLVDQDGERRQTASKLRVGYECCAVNGGVDRWRKGLSTAASVSALRKSRRKCTQIPESQGKFTLDAET